MIYDMTTFVGAYERRPVGLETDALARRALDWGVERLFAGRIDHLRQENGRSIDPPRAPARIGSLKVECVPVIDPSLPGWAEFADAHDQAHANRLPFVRLHPGFHGYRMDHQDLIGPLVDWAHFRGTVIQVVVSLDDARRRHPASQVLDVPVGEVVQAARAFPHQPFLVSGSTFTTLDALGDQRPGNLWADTGRVEATEGIARLVRAGWGDRLVFASFEPLMIYHSALARVLVDLDDAAAARILKTNAQDLIAEA